MLNISWQNLNEINLPKWNSIGVGMTGISRTFRVFVSSTFNDFINERNALQENVFPKLEKLCKEEGFSFQPVDLRWGVSEEAAINQETMKICLEEIKRSQEVSPKPNFIVLLGNRYGWIPVPYQIPKKEFDAIYDLTEENEDKQLLNKWFNWIRIQVLKKIYQTQCMIYNQ